MSIEQIIHQILEINERDKVVMLYLKRCQYYRDSGVPDGWEGTEVFDEK